MNNMEFPETSMMITGSNGPDMLSGTLGDDIIDALGGDDTINASNGMDVIDGGTGTDRIVFNLAVAEVTPFLGDRDFIFTDSGMTDSAGLIDTSYGNIEALTVVTLQTDGAIQDRFNNVLDASAVTSNIDVTLISYGGNDTLTGGAGDDAVGFRLGNFEFGETPVTGSADGGVGTDAAVLILFNRTSQLTITASGDNDNFNINSFAGGGKRDMVNFSNVESIFLSDVVFAAPGGDDGAQQINMNIAAISLPVFFDATLGGMFSTQTQSFGLAIGDGDDEITYAAGNDSISLAGGTNSADGGGGVDSISYSSAPGAVTVDLSITTQQVTGWGLDTISNFENLNGSPHDDVLTGSGGANVIGGDFGNDIIDGGAGDDILFGNDGSDILLASAGNDSLFGGDDEKNSTDTGTDLVSFENAGSGVSVTIPTPSIATVTVAGFGSDLWDNIEGVRGSNFDDILTGGLRDDLFEGLQGNDLIRGRNGDDTINGGAGTDNLLGQVGDDVLSGGDDQDFLYGGLNDDILNGGSGDDRLNGQGQGDTLNGDAGNDLLRGGIGNDVLNGGTGNDSLFGGENFDQLNGDDGIDFLDGGAGVDFLDGGAGNDRIEGGLGRDISTGGEGIDRFVFRDFDFAGLTITTADRITDFSSGDRIDLLGVDAVAGGGDDMFTFIGDTAFGGNAGELRYEFVGSATLISGDTDGDGNADFAIRLDGRTTLAETDFVL